MQAQFFRSEVSELYNKSTSIENYIGDALGIKNEAGGGQAASYEKTRKKKVSNWATIDHY